METTPVKLSVTFSDTHLPQGTLFKVYLDFMNVHSWSSPFPEKSPVELETFPHN